MADALVNPLKPANTPELGSGSVLVSSASDMKKLCHLMQLDHSKSRDLFISRLYPAKTPDCFSVTGPFVGAPYAVMLLETLIAWGIRRVLFFGWCGAVSPNVKIGDIILPSAALVDEGTSGSYANREDSISFSSDTWRQTVKTGLNSHGLVCHEGKVWTTDAIYRETEEKVRYYQEQNVLAVEMETSAVFTVSKFRNIETCAILIVSDELSSFEWKPGFTESRFRESRIMVCDVIREVCRT